MKREEITQTIETLVTHLRESETLYRTAVNNAISDEFREMLRERAQRRADFAEALRAFNREDHEAAHHDDTALNTIHRGLLTIKAAMTIERDKTDDLILAESQEADKRLLAAYEEAMGKELPRALQGIMHSQYSQIQAAHAYIGAAIGGLDEYAVVGLFAEPVNVQGALNALRAAGYSDDKISVLAQDEAAQELLSDDRVETAQAGAGAAAAGGAVVGGLIGLAAGIMIPIALPVLAAGAVAAAIGGAAVGAGIGATYGGIFGALLGWGMAEEDTHRYIEGVRRGEILVAVQAQPEQADEAAAILRRYHGRAVATRHERVETLDSN